MCNLPPPDAPTSATVLPAGIFKLKSVNTLCHINKTAISNIYVYQSYIFCTQTQKISEKNTIVLIKRLISLTMKCMHRAQNFVHFGDASEISVFGPT